jgi:hypothetical protein
MAVAWKIALALLCAAGCERSDSRSTRTPRDRDPCAFIKPSDAISMLGPNAVRGHFDPDVCEWRVDFPDRSRSWLRFETGATGYAPVIVVTKSEITYEGKLVVDPDPRITERLTIGDGGALEVSDSSGVHVRWSRNGAWAKLQFDSGGPSAPRPTTKVEEMKALARQIDAAL